MAHLELSVSEPRRRRAPVEGSSLDRWVAAVSDATEPALVIDVDARVVAMSERCRLLLGLDRGAVGRDLLNGVLRLLDFSQEGAALDNSEVGKVPPLLALSSGGLARGVIRVQFAGGAGACTLDAIATPLVDGATTVGSLTFFCVV